MKALVGRLVAASSLVIASATCAYTANAAVTINVSEVGSSIVAVGFGTFNTAGFTGTAVTNAPARLRASTGTIRVGQTSLQGIAFGTASTAFGTSTNLIDASSATGDYFGTATNGFILADDYISGSALSGTATFLNQSYTALGITPGQTVYSINNDTVTVNILPTGVAAVPEPATWAMLILGMGIVGFGLRRKVRESEAKFDAEIKAMTAGASA